MRKTLMVFVGLITFFVFSSSIHASAEDSTPKENGDSFEKISNEYGVEEGNSHFEYDNRLNSIFNKPVYFTGAGIVAYVGILAGEATIKWATGKPPSEWMEIGLSKVTKPIKDYLGTELYTSARVNRFGLVTPYVQPCPPGEVCPQDEEEDK